MGCRLKFINDNSIGIAWGSVYDSQIEINVLLQRKVLYLGRKAQFYLGRKAQKSNLWRAAHGRSAATKAQHTAGLFRFFVLLSLEFISLAF